MNHQEQNLQIKCVRWFRIQHPALAKLLFHPKNEGTTANARRIGGIAKAEGVVAGVADLILLLPASRPAEKPTAEKRSVCCDPVATQTSALAIEMKTATGRQSSGQKTWQRYFQAAGGQYTVVRTFDEFTSLINDYISRVPPTLLDSLRRTHADTLRQEEAAAKARLNKLLSK